MGLGATRAARLAAKAAELPPDPACVDCGSRRLRSLCGVKLPVRCYRCIRARWNKPTVERHHFLSEDLTPEDVIPVPANDHRALDDLKWDLPRRVWTNPKGLNLLFTIAYLAMVAGLGYLLDRTGRRLAAWLLAFDSRMRQDEGPDWEDHYGIPTFGWDDEADDERPAP